MVPLHCWQNSRIISFKFGAYPGGVEQCKRNRSCCSAGRGHPCRSYGQATGHFNLLVDKQANITSRPLLCWYDFPSSRPLRRPVHIVDAILGPGRILSGIVQNSEAVVGFQGARPSIGRLQQYLAWARRCRSHLVVGIRTFSSRKFVI